MANPKSAPSKAASAASKVMHSKTATKAEKSVAAAALVESKTKDHTSKKVASEAGKILHSKTASKEAKSAAAAALHHAPSKKAPAKKK